LANVLSTLAMVSGLLAVLIPLRVILRMKRERTTGGAVGSPFFSQAANAFLWLSYGLLSGDFVIVLANSCGLLLALFYIYVFVQFTAASTRKYFVGVLGVTLFTLGCVVGMEDAAARNTLGFVGCVINVFALGSPLEAVPVVLAEKSTRVMPLDLTLGNFTVAFLWTLYGFLLRDDVYIWLPNFLGFLCSLVQLALFAIYPATKGRV